MGMDGCTVFEVGTWVSLCTMFGSGRGEGKANDRRGGEIGMLHKDEEGLGGGETGMLHKDAGGGGRERCMLHMNEEGKKLACCIKLQRRCLRERGRTEGC